MNAQEETMTYRKLFNIHYKNKTFTIFIDKYGRRTFLEVDESGNYQYPFIDDFIELHKMYNERDIFISHDSHYYGIGEGLPIHRDPKVKFKEMVQISIGTIAQHLALVTAGFLVANSITGSTFKLVQENNQLKVVSVYFEGSVIDNTSELDPILGYQSVSIDDIVTTINQNEKIGEPFKEYAIRFVNYMHNKYPNTDSRIFYENMKNVSVKIKPESQMGKYTAGTYHPVLNVISIKESYAANAEVITHEIAHSYHYWKENAAVMPKYRVEVLGHSLDEAATNKVISGMLLTHTYQQEGRVLDYFLSCVDFDYYDYEREGISKLIKLLKEKYPTVDIDYIVHSVDVMNETYFNTGERIQLEKSLETLDEMFKLCIDNIDLNSGSVYQPFIDFLKLIDYNYLDLAGEYLARYNDILLEKGYDQTEVNTKLQDFINEIECFKCEKSEFKEFCSKLDITTINGEDIYKPFKDYINFYIQYISEGEIKNYFYDMLDIYNDFLYCNGYTRDETITREKMKTKIKKFEGVTVVGYTVTSDNVLHPIVDIKNKDQLYNKETRIPTLNEQGKIVLIDKEDTIAEEITDNHVFQYRFIKAFFDNLDKDSLVFDENYWQNIFWLRESQYKKFSLYFDGNKIAEEFLQDLFIAVGQKEDGTNTFRLIRTDQLIDQENQDSKSVIVPMEEYMSDYLYSNQNSTSVELNDLLSQDYFEKMSMNDERFSSINYSTDDLSSSLNQSKVHN